MTIFRFSFISLMALSVASCGEIKGEIILPDLSDHQLVERMQLCMSEIPAWREKGVWIHGGVQPAVNRDAWSDLSDEDQQEIADVAACIQSSGSWEPQEVQIVSEGFKVPIDKIHSSNTLFYEKFQ